MMNFSIARCLFSIGGCTTILGNISADTAVSSAGAIGGLGVLIDKCPNCELAKAANKSLLDDE